MLRLLLWSIVAVLLASALSRFFFSRSQPQVTQAKMPNDSTSTSAMDAAKPEYSLASLPPYRPSEPIPAFFFGHGSPALLEVLKEDMMASGLFEHADGPLGTFLREFGPFLLKTYKPKAIVVISAHWETEPGAAIEIMDNDDAWQQSNLYYDYYGFPKAAYDVKFASVGDAQVSRRVSELLSQRGIKNNLIKNQRALDHGCFCPFKLMFGDAPTVPIIEVSQFVNHAQNLLLGTALSQLRHEGILILSGGLTIHTFKDMSAFSAKTAKQGYLDLDRHVVNAVSQDSDAERREKVEQVMRMGYFRKAHPSIEHFTPLGVAMGAGGEGGSRVVSDLYGATTVAFGL